MVFVLLVQSCPIRRTIACSLKAASTTSFSCLRFSSVCFPIKSQVHWPSRSQVKPFYLKSPCSLITSVDRWPQKCVCLFLIVRYPLFLPMLSFGGFSVRQILCILPDLVLFFFFLPGAIRSWPTSFTSILVAFSLCFSYTLGLFGRLGVISVLGFFTCGLFSLQVKAPQQSGLCSIYCMYNNS